MTAWYTNYNSDSGSESMNTDDWGSAESGYKIPDHELGKFEYAHLCKLAHRSRDVYGKGKYINRWLRLKLSSNEEPELWINGDKFMSVNKDNFATVHMDTQDIWGGSGSYVIALNRWIPFTIERHRTGIYRIAHNLSIFKHLEKTLDKEKCYWRTISAFVRQCQVVCKGLKYNLLTGELLNPNKDNEPQKCVENTDKRKLWRRKIIAFKKQLRTRAKLGLVDSTIDRLKNVDKDKLLNMVETHAKLLGKYDNRISEPIYALRKDTSKVANDNIIDLIDTDWNTPESIEFLAKHIDENAMPFEIFMPICLALKSISWHRNWRYADDLDTDKDISYFFNKLSIHLRRHYGVIEKEATINGASDLHSFNRSRGHYRSLPINIKQVYNIFKGVLDDSKDIK
tara:strand:+ start:504 stop:1694 length:1191 start_codon:yes stop_codon:yes gene_type:complete